MTSISSTDPENKPAIRSRFAKLPKRVLWISLLVLVVIIGAAIFTFVKVQQTKAAATAQQPALQTAVARQGNLILRASGTGTLIAANEVNLEFKTSGILTKLNVKLGDQVKAGDLLAQTDDANQQVQLAQAQEALNELTSPSAIATAQIDVTTAQANVINAQAVLNNQQYWQNAALVQDQYAKLVIAKAALDKAQAAYDSANVGQYINNTGEANLYQAFYNAQQAYNTAQFNYSIYSQKPTQRQLNAAQATLDLAKAKLTEDQNYVAALTGGTVPDNATGSGLNQLNQAKLSLQDAQNNLNATKLYASISGTVMAISNKLGETVGSGTFITIADLSQSELQIYMDQNDWSNIKLGYVTNVTFDALPEQVFTGKVTQVSPQLITIQGSAVVEGLVLLDQKQASGATLKLPLGVSASVDVVAAQANNVILVPVQALHQLSPGNYAVFVMTGGKPTLRIVTVGLQDSTYAEIKTGLKAGDVVTTGIQATTGGSLVPTP
jgi:RND family efflux transporter MFP subunit